MEELVKRLSKAQLAELYADLYRQVMGEQSSDAEIAQDLKRRSIILGYGRQVRTPHPDEWVRMED